MTAESALETRRAQCVLQALAHYPGFYSGLDHATLHAALASQRWPLLEPLNASWQSKRPASSPVQGFAHQPPEQRYAAAQYERCIHESGWIPTRENSAHDLFNALCWLRWPLSKQALNRAHIEQLCEHQQQRSRHRDALTLLDEAGVVVVSDRLDLLEQLAGHHWHKVWWQERKAWLASSEWHIIGHGLLEQCLQPYIGLTAKALLLHRQALRGQSLDAWLAQQIASGRFHHPHQLAPLPLLGLPECWPDNRQASFYQQRDYFRPASVRRPAATAWTSNA